MKANVYNVYIINGVIFEGASAYALGFKPGVGKETKIQPAMITAICNAVIASDPNNPESFCGNMNDQWGHSEITNFEVSDKVLSFTKKYENRPVIEFRFETQIRGVWQGTWNSIDSVGVANCVVTITDLQFFYCR